LYQIHDQELQDKNYKSIYQKKQIAKNYTPIKNHSHLPFTFSTKPINHMGSCNFHPTSDFQKKKDHFKWIKKKFKSLDLGDIWIHNRAKWIERVLHFQELKNSDNQHHFMNKNSECLVLDNIKYRIKKISKQILFLIKLKEIVKIL
jgi:hypothetical protein